MIGHLKPGDEQEVSKPEVQQDIAELLTIFSFIESLNKKKVEPTVVDYNPNAVVPGNTPLNRNW